LNPDGSIDGSYASVPIAPDLVVVGIAIDSAGRVVLFGTLLVSTAGYIARFLPSGGGGGGCSYRELLGLLALFLVRAGVTARRASTLA
jgi:hypothetical protein